MSGRVPLCCKTDEVAAIKISFVEYGAHATPGWMNGWYGSGCGWYGVRKFLVTFVKRECIEGSEFADIFSAIVSVCFSPGEYVDPDSAVRKGWEIDGSE